MAGKGSIYIEILPVGHALEIAAIDSETGREVRFIAPTSATEDEIKQLARAKMDYVIRKEEEARNKKPPDGRGGIVV